MLYPYWVFWRFRSHCKVIEWNIVSYLQSAQRRTHLNVCQVFYKDESFVTLWFAIKRFLLTLVRALCVYSSAACHLGRLRNRKRVKTSSRLSVTWTSTMRHCSAVSTAMRSIVGVECLHVCTSQSTSEMRHPSVPRSIYISWCVCIVSQPGQSPRKYADCHLSTDLS